MSLANSVAHFEIDESVINLVPSEVAQKYLHFLDGCGADRYNGEKSGFFGWAAAMLHAATGMGEFQTIEESVRKRLSVVDERVLENLW